MEVVKQTKFYKLIPTSENFFINLDFWIEILINKLLILSNEKHMKFFLIVMGIGISMLIFTSINFLFQKLCKHISHKKLLEIIGNILILAYIVIVLRIIFLIYYLIIRQNLDFFNLNTYSVLFDSTMLDSIAFVTLMGLFYVCINFIVEFTFILFILPHIYFLIKTEASLTQYFILLFIYLSFYISAKINIYKNLGNKNEIID